MRRPLTKDLVRASTLESWLDRFLNARIALPAFVLELNVLDRDGTRIGVKIRQCLKLRHPAAIHLVSNYQLSRFVVELNNDVLPKILERYFGAEPGTKFPDFVGPFFE